MTNQHFDASLGSVTLWLHSVFESEAKGTIKGVTKRKK